MKIIITLLVASLPALAGTPWVTSYTPSGARTDGPYSMGIRFQMGSTSYYLSSVGRLCLAGDAATHTLYLVDTTDTILATTDVNMSGCTSGTYVFAAVTACAQLAAGSIYYLLSTETGGSEPWGDAAPPTTTQIATLLSGAYSTTFPYTGGPIITANGGQMFVGLNFTSAIACGSGLPAASAGFPIIY
jgi:hypothetical protein